MPFAFICYVVAYIDRVNIGFAATELQRDLGLSQSEYGFGAGLFFLAYCLFEIPSNLMLERVGARRWIARILIGWGLVSMGTMFMTDVWSFMVARVLLGIAEAGFFPGMVLYLTYWIPSAERARTGALFMMAAPVAVIVGGPLSEALLKLDGLLRARGMAMAVPRRRAPRRRPGPAGAGGLDRSSRGRGLAGATRSRMARPDDGRLNRRSGRLPGTPQLATSFASGHVWMLSGVLFMHSLVNYGIFLWLPKMLQDVSGTRGFALSTITAIPFVAALAAMVLVGRHSDRTGERKLHVAACAVTSAVGLWLAAASQGSLWLLVSSFTLSQMAQRALVGPFWAMPPIFLGGTAAAAGIALINAIGNLGGFAGPAIMGMLRDLTGGYAGGLLVLSGALVVEALLALSLRFPPLEQTAAVKG